jgi:hypothetical protein
VAERVLPSQAELSLVISGTVYHLGFIKITFQKLDLFPYSSIKIPTQLVPLNRAVLSH